MPHVDSVIEPLAKTLLNLPREVKIELARRLNESNTIAEVKAAADTAERTRIAKIAAMRAERTPAFMIAEGELKRCGINIDDVTDVVQLDKLFAAAVRRPSIEKRIEIKDALFHAGLLAA
jgi:hypothetical protein